MCGLGLLHTVVFKMRDYEHLVTTMQKSISQGGGNFEFALQESIHRNQAVDDDQLSERDMKQKPGASLPFIGDVVPDPHGSYPPLAWTLIWKGTYSNMYGDYLPLDIRLWGYVMWDASRLETEGGKDLLLRQMMVWRDWDPRDSDILSDILP
jgi:hypothetical protein